MGRPTPLRLRTLSEQERAEPTRLISLRVPRSWIPLLRADGVISDKLLEPLAVHIKRIRGLQAKEAR